MLPSSVPLSVEEKLHVQTQLLDVVEQAILAVDLTGIIVLWNHFAETLYGWSMEEVQGRNIEEVLASPQLMESVRANLEQLKHGKIWSGEFLVNHRNGTTFMVQISASLIQNEQQILISIVSISCDRAEHQQLQEANRLLAEAGVLLSNAVDYEAPLTTLSKLVVPQIADWCIIHMLKPDGSIEQVALEPAKISDLQAAYEWLQNDLPNDDTDGLPAVLRSGEPKLVAEVAPQRRAAAAAIKSYMIVPLIAHPQILGAVTFVSADSDRRFDRNDLALAENLAGHIAIYLEKARLYHDSERLNDELEQRVSERTFELREAIEQLKQSEATVQAQFRISNELNATLEVNTILDALAREAIQIVNGESGFAGLLTAKGMTVRKYYLKGVSVPFEYTWPSGKGIPGWVLEHKVPYGTSDAAHDPVIILELEFNANVQSVICTPILDSASEVLGFFHILNKKKGGEGFTIADQEMLMALAPVASIAIQNALAYQQRLLTVAELKESSKQLQALAAGLEMAREEERTHFARELHDQLGQALTAMKFDLVWLTDRLGKKDAALVEKAKNITAQMDTMVKTVRRIATELRPGMLDDLGLAASIEWQARDFEKRTGIVCKVTIPTKELLLSRAQSVALFRIFQEALTNIQRHASAHHIEVELTAKPETLMLQVHDDGRGIRAKEIAGLKSLGLLGMRERAKQLGGSFDIQGVPGDGTIVTISIPIPNNEK